MAEETLEEDIEEESVGVEPAEPELEGKTRRPTEALRRPLTEEELRSSGVAVLMDFDNRRLERERDDLLRIASLYHQADKERAVLRDARDSAAAANHMRTACLTLSGVFIGLAPTYWSLESALPTPHYIIGPTCFVLGVVLFMVGLRSGGNR